MAHIEKKLGKRGLSYRFIVSAGFDCNGKRIFHKKTWKPPPNMTEKQADKAANREAIIFEQSIAQGYSPDNKQTFAEYAEYVLDLKSRAGKSTERYPAIEHCFQESMRRWDTWQFRIFAPFI